MITVLFICHGNICRSPMAEFLLKDMVAKAGLSDRFQISSAATSAEEIGNPVHYGTRDKLRSVGISTAGKYARQMTKKDYAEYDYLIGMDAWNIRNMLRITGGDPGHKVYRLLDFTAHPRDIADPWYTGDFEEAYADILEGCEGLLHKLSFEPSARPNACKKFD